MAGWAVGHAVRPGDTIAHLGAPEENGNWPAHVHFQVLVHICRLFLPFISSFSWSEKENISERGTLAHSEPRFFQIMTDMQEEQGHFVGVCSRADRAKYIGNLVVNPAGILFP